MSDPSREFTHAAYARLIEETRDAYDCVGFEIMDDPRLAERRFCILRHDIDAAPIRSLHLARIEAERGVRATYNVHLTGFAYSALEPEVRGVLRAIYDLGHAIGLHFDPAWHGIASEAELEGAIAWELAILRGILPGVEVTAFSFHNTTPFTMGCVRPAYGGLWNAYAAALRDHAAYCSDSNGFWRFATWGELLRAGHERLQVLTHPEWWTPAPGCPAERICSGLDDRARRAWTDYRSTLLAAGREVRSAHPAALATISERLGPAGADAMRLWFSGHRAAAAGEIARLLAVRGQPVTGALADTLGDLAAARLDPAAARVDALLDGLAERAALLPAC